MREPNMAMKSNIWKVALCYIQVKQKEFCWSAAGQVQSYGLGSNINQMYSLTMQYSVQGYFTPVQCTSDNHNLVHTNSNKLLQTADYS